MSPSARMGAGSFTFVPVSLPAICFALLLMLAGIGATLLTPQKNPAARAGLNLETLVPAAFGEWRPAQVGALVMPDPETDRLTRRIYSGILARAYEDQAGNQVLLVIAYGGDQSDDLQLHRPEICYAANGYKVGAPHKETLVANGIPIHLTRMETADTYARELVSYWMRVGPRQIHSSLDRQWVKLKSGLLGQVPDGVLVRLSSGYRAGDAPAARALQDQFLADLVQALDDDARQVLLGRENTVGSS